MSRILIVDDEKSIRTTLSAFLEDEGYDVEVAEDVRRAQELLSQGNYDVVISDIILPGVSGIVLLKQVRETAPDIKVIIITGAPTIETAAEAVRAGASDYITKPVNKFAILRSVANAIKVSEMEDSVREHTARLKIMVKSMAAREIRMSELKQTIKKLREQLQEAGITPVADDPAIENQGAR